MYMTSASERGGRRVELPKDAYELGEETFTLHKPPSTSFTLKTVVGIEPAKNASSGLYESSTPPSARPRGFGELRTDDRPDACRPLLVEWKRTRRSFILLSNGNEVGRGEKGEALGLV